jgi:hypothetical protein
LPPLNVRNSGCRTWSRASRGIHANRALLERVDRRKRAPTRITAFSVPLLPRPQSPSTTSIRSFERRGGWVLSVAFRENEADGEDWRSPIPDRGFAGRRTDRQPGWRSTLLAAAALLGIEALASDAWLLSESSGGISANRPFVRFRSAATRPLTNGRSWPWSATLESVTGRVTTAEVKVVRAQ